MRSFLRQSVAGLRLLLVLTVLVGLAYPLVVFGVGRLTAARADGSLVVVHGRVVGSRLIGQRFPGPQWFHPRPSAGGYDPLATGASNLGPNNPRLIRMVRAREARVARADHVRPAQVPADAVTASGSGLDPDISPAYARLQVARIARVRDLPQGQVRKLVDEHVQPRPLGFLGEPTVNVLELNLALTRLSRP